MSPSSRVARIRRELVEWAHRVECEANALALAYRDPRTPWYARAWVAIVLAYALSPIDLIPDFIPVVGYLDDLVLVPLGIWLALRMIPSKVMSDCRERVREGEDTAALRRAGAMAVGIAWLVLAVVMMVHVLRLFSILPA